MLIADVLHQRILSYHYFNWKRHDLICSLSFLLYTIKAHIEILITNFELRACNKHVKDVLKIIVLSIFKGGKSDCYLDMSNLKKKKTSKSVHCVGWVYYNALYNETFYSSYWRSYWDFYKAVFRPLNNS